MLGRSSVIARNFSQSMVRFSGHGGVPGEVSNVPDDGIVWLHNLCLALANPDGKSIIYKKTPQIPPCRTCPSACRTSTGSLLCSPSAVFWALAPPS